MLTKVDVQNLRSDILSLSLQDISGGYVVKEIDGLDPVDATLTTSSMAQLDGAQPQNAQRSTRNITMKLGIEPDFTTYDDTVESLRRNLYNWFMTKALVGMNFYIDNVLYVMTSGQVESCENNRFSSDPEVDISIICYDPDFIAPAAITLSGNTVTGPGQALTIDYDGTSDAGIVVTLNVNAPLPDGFEVDLQDAVGVLHKFIIAGSYSAGDVVTLTTIPGSKSLILTRSGLQTSILNEMDPTSEWLAFTKGESFFWLYANNLTMPYTVSYTPRYGAL